MTALWPKLCHARLGVCELLRIEGTDWVVRVIDTGGIYRFPSERRREFRVQAATPVIEASPRAGPLSPPMVVAPPSPTPQLQRSATGGANAPHAWTGTRVRTDPSLRDADPRGLRRAFESIRSGLPALDGCARRLSMGFSEFSRTLQGFLDIVAEDGGCPIVIRGQYGQGKTFSLSLLESLANESGFITVRAEVDAFENRLDKPHALYREFVRRMRVPGQQGEGVAILAALVDTKLRQSLERNTPAERYAWVRQHAQSDALAWLMCDPRFLQKPELLGLLKNELVNGVSQCRRAHAHLPGGSYWPYFRYGTQSDFACQTLSGLSRLGRTLGFRGLVVLLDEAEKWHNLQWKEQVRASSLIGGLVWAASAPEGTRGRDREPATLVHSGGGGFDYTTGHRCHLGVAIAMTPRDELEDPVEGWRECGPVSVVSLPDLTAQRLREYCTELAASYSAAYRLPPVPPERLAGLQEDTVGRWQRSGHFTMRSGVQALIAVLDEYRSCCGDETENA